jgi:hypothetical protein
MRKMSTYTYHFLICFSIYGIGALAMALYVAILQYTGRAGALEPDGIVAITSIAMGLLWPLVIAFRLVNLALVGLRGIIEWGGLAHGE